MPNRKDREIEEKVIRGLAAEKLLRPYDLKIQVIEGVAHLQGIVDVLAEKNRAGEVARSTPGVFGVENGITVCTDGDINDSAVQFEVFEELRADPRLEHIGVDVNGGVVRLVGRVDTLYDESKAVQRASTARGVRDVRSELKVDEGWPHDSATVANRVERALAGIPQLATGRIRTSTSRGIVTLKGTVTRREDMEMAAEIAKGVEGVRSVRNELSLSPDVESRVVTRIFSELQDDPFVREAPVSIAVVNGEIQVEGEVKSKEQKRRVEQAVREALHAHRGEVIGVNNKLIIQPD